eukprot:1159026-Pelagomonas_calceolata.AAC.4
MVIMHKLMQASCTSSTSCTPGPLQKLQQDAETLLRAWALSEAKNSSRKLNLQHKWLFLKIPASCNAQTLLHSWSPPRDVNQQQRAQPPAQTWPPSETQASSKELNLLHKPGSFQCQPAASRSQFFMPDPS